MREIKEIFSEEDDSPQIFIVGNKLDLLTNDDHYDYVAEKANKLVLENDN